MNIIRFTKIVAVAMLIAAPFAASADDHEAIEKIMKGGFKGDTSLVKKAVAGKATPAELKKLHELVAKLAMLKPEKGDPASWKEKTTALVAATQAAVDGKPNAGALLKDATNCKACHSKHRPEKDKK